MPGPLEGIAILDLSRILSGPYCTMVLSDMGADVVKVEHPQGGDTARGSGPFVDGVSTYFLSLNRGKKSVTLDLATDQGRDLFLRLVDKADVVVENFKPGVMARLGLDHESLEARNPRLVCCAISGFGQTGPDAGLPALDVIVQGMGGIMSITGEPGGPPIRPGASMGDIAAGLFAAVGILSALMERAVSGRGQFVDIGMMDCQLAVQENAFSRYLNAGEVPKALGTRHPVFTPFQAFEAKDGWIVVATAGGRKDQWPLFCATIDRVDLIDDPDYVDGWQRTRHYERLGPVMTEALKRRTVDDWVERFRQVGIACGPVNRIDQAAAQPQVEARRMIVDVPGEEARGLKVVNTPVKLSRTPGGVKGRWPELGEHNVEVLGGWLGLTAEQVGRLADDGVL